MAVTDAWEMGVAVSIYNHKFRYGTFKGGTLNGAVTSGASTVTVDDTDPDINLIAQRDDSIVLGESSNSSYAGKSETLQINSLTSTIITPKTTIVNSYADEDNFRVYGTKLAGGWLPDESGANVITTPSGIKSNVGDYGSRKVDDYAQKVVFDFTNATFAQVGDSAFGRDTGLKYAFNSNPFLELVHYRGGIIYKSHGKNVSGDCHVNFNVHDGKRTFINSYGDITLNQNEWTELNTGINAIVQPTTINLNSATNGYIKIYCWGAATEDYIALYLDDIYLEHAHSLYPVTDLTEALTTRTFEGLSELDYQTNEISVLDSSEFSAGERLVVVAKTNNIYIIGTIDSIPDNNSIILQENATFNNWSGTSHTPSRTLSTTIPAGSRVQQANEGYYTMTEYPLMSSLSYDIINTMGQSKLADGSMKIWYPMSEADKGTRYQIKCGFSNVPATMWKKIRRLMWWQENGNLLNLHPKYNDLPSVMTGYMEITNVRKSELWDLTYRSFDFTFTEAF